ncbi:hypothetical protein ACIQZN_26640 [Streptomyces sp. NPDC097595]|uniref:hypothetical protein n=1 Tax=Streptomyces sp. NPDC097595 TaxID=3366090 RepID=UPI003810CBCA
MTHLFAVSYGAGCLAGPVAPDMRGVTQPDEPGPHDMGGMSGMDGLTMNPHGNDVTVRPKSPLRPGEVVSFALHFAHGKPLRVNAVVVRPGTEKNLPPRP